MSYDDIVADFEFLDDWEDRYRYVIELGRKLEPLPDEAHNDANKVQGCVSQVWLETNIERSGTEPVLHFKGDSDAHIVRGLVYIIMTIFSRKTPQQIVDTDATAILTELGLSQHLSPMRTNGLFSMVERIKEIGRSFC